MCCCAQGDAEAQLEGTPAVIRLSGPLCFANAAHLKEHLLELVVRIYLNNESYPQNTLKLWRRAWCSFSGNLLHIPYPEMWCMHKRLAWFGGWVLQHAVALSDGLPGHSQTNHWGLI